MNNQNLYDSVIIGSGIAGLSAGMYCGRFGLKTLIIGDMPGGIITTTDMVENYPGILEISGIEMGQTFLRHAKKFNAEIKNSRVQKIEKIPAEKGRGFKIFTSKEEFSGKTVILTTGTAHKKLNIPGETGFAARGVSYCALCDGAFYKNKDTAIVGGGDSSAVEALILAQHSKKIYMLVRRNRLRAEPINFKRVIENEKIIMMYNTSIVEIRGKEKVESLLLNTGEELRVDGVFIAVGYDPLSGLAKDLGVALDDKGQIKIDRNSKTNVEGVFAAGDVVDSAFKQAITGAAEGVIAAVFAYKYVQNNEQ